MLSALAAVLALATAHPAATLAAATPTPQASAPSPSASASAAPTAIPTTTPAASPATPAPTLAPTPTPVPTPSPTPARPAAVAIVWHFGPAPYADSSVRAASVALAAPDVLGSLLRALRAHPRAHFSLAIDAGALDGLARAAAGDTALQALVGSHLGGGARLDETLRVLGQMPVLDSSLAATPAAHRYRTLTTRTHFTTNDYLDFVGFAALVHLAAAGELPDANLLQKSALSAADASAALTALAQADAKTLEGLKTDANGGQLELLADPAGEPVLPLLIDGGGHSGPNVVLVGAAADAAYSLDAAMREITALVPGGSPGVYSPHGAYDDEAAAMIEQHHAAFALFSDRVLRTSPIGGSRAAVAAADAAAFHAFAVRAAAGPALTALFWSEDEGQALDTMSPRLPASAIGARVIELARAAGARGGDGSVILLRLDVQGLWNRRADRARVVDELAGALASGAVPSVTAGQYARTNPNPVNSYGFSAACDEGSLSYWMGSANQSSMWEALGDARKAAGGDAALKLDATRVPLLEAEAARWYAAPGMIAPTTEIARIVDQFRALITSMYRGAGKSAPSPIAPLRVEGPPPTPRPTH